MDDNKKDLSKEIKAMETIQGALSSLDDKSKERVINWAISAFSINDISKLETEVNDDKSVKDCHQPKSIKKFWEDKKPQNYYQKFAVLGYFLEYLQNKSEFAKKDLEQVWSDTREAVPSKDTFRVALNDTVSKYQYLLTGSKKRLYRVGRRGQELVETLPKDLPKTLTGTIKKRGRTKNKSKNK